MGGRHHAALASPISQSETSYMIHPTDADTLTTGGQVLLRLPTGTRRDGTSSDFCPLPPLPLSLPGPDLARFTELTLPPPARLCGSRSHTHRNEAGRRRRRRLRKRQGSTNARGRDRRSRHPKVSSTSQLAPAHERPPLGTDIDPFRSVGFLAGGGPSFGMSLSHGRRKWVRATRTQMLTSR